MRPLIVLLVLVVGVAVTVARDAEAPPVGQRVDARKPSADQWQLSHNPNFSPLTPITPQNVSKLTKAWTFNMAASPTAGSLGWTNRCARHAV
jgi:glucose dehydrogenase